MTFTVSQLSSPYSSGIVNVTPGSSDRVRSDVPPSRSRPAISARSRSLEGAQTPPGPPQGLRSPPRDRPTHGPCTRCHHAPERSRGRNRGTTNTGAPVTPRSVAVNLPARVGCVLNVHSDSRFVLVEQLEVSHVKRRSRTLHSDRNDGDRHALGRVAGPFVGLIRSLTRCFAVSRCCNIILVQWLLTAE